MDLPPIREAWLAAKRAKIKQFPSNNLRASGIGHACDRYHYHSIKDWREKALHDPILQSIFDEGALHETDVIRQLTDLGFTVVEQQRAFQIDKPLITGHIDGILRWEGKDFPFDVKSIASYDYDKIDSMEDFTQSKKPHQRGYVAQLQLYLLMTSNEVGCFIMKNKQTGEIKPIWGQIDIDYCDMLIKRAQRVYESLAAETPPKRIDDLDECSKCAYAHICLPDLRSQALTKLIDDQDTAAMMERMEQLKPVVKEYEQMEDQIDELKNKVGPGEYVCGDFLMRIKEHERKNKEPITWTDTVTKYLKKQIVRLTVKEKNANV
ncbi:MAG: hypothetical protein KBC72_00440 [Acinetobacter sp.]|nr:hypothetical protein [Acinetobacter sp.]